MLQVRGSSPDLDTPRPECIPGQRQPALIQGDHSPERGLSADALECISGSIMKSTRKHYDSKFSKWEEYCSSHNISDAKNTNVNNIINFLSSQHKNGLSAQTINVFRSAISFFHSYIDGSPVGQHPLVVRCLQGIYKAKPPQPKYATTWDIQGLLDLLAGPSYNPNSTISELKLKHKLVILILSSTACRQSVITRLLHSSDHLVERSDHFVLHPSGWDKTSRFTRKVHPLMIFDHPTRPEISPFLCLKSYLERVPRGTSSSLFLSDKKPFPVSLSELRNWVSAIMKSAGVPNQFSVHSIRGAVTSRAAFTLTTAEILEAADWKSESVFRTFYLRNTSPSIIDNRRSFQAAIL